MSSQAKYFLVAASIGVIVMIVGEFLQLPIGDDLRAVGWAIVVGGLVALWIWA